MSRVAYVNGQYIPHGQASVHIEDRGFQFADGVYEVWAVLDGRLAELCANMKKRGIVIYTVRVEAGTVRPAFKASGDITSMSQADGYIEIPAQTDIVEKGEIVDVKLL